MMDEPRTTLDIVRDLIYYVEKYQWSGRIRQGCHCHPEYRDGCPECDVLESEGEHEPNCPIKALLKEAGAWYEVEERIQQEAEYG